MRATIGVADTEDKRNAVRTAARLRPAKLLTEDGGFIGDCAITDRSACGARVRLFGGAELAADMVLFDETETIAWPARLVWTAGREAGLRFLAPSQAVRPEEAERVAGRYYAVGN